MSQTDLSSYHPNRMENSAKHDIVDSYTNAYNYLHELLQQAVIIMYTKYWYNKSTEIKVYLKNKESLKVFNNFIDLYYDTTIGHWPIPFIAILLIIFGKADIVL